MRLLLTSVVLMLMATNALAGNLVITPANVGDYTTGPIDDNVVVLDGAFWQFDSGTINGNVVVTDGSSAEIENSTIGGNVTIDETSSVTCSNSTINGNVQVAGGSEFTTLDDDGVVQSGCAIKGNLIANRAASVNLSAIAGRTLVTGNVIAKRTSSAISILSTDVRGNVILKKNDVVDIFVFDVTIDGNLISLDNAAPTQLFPPVTVGGNTIGDFVP